MLEPMTTFVVHLPTSEKYRLDMFGRDALQILQPHKLASLKRDRSVVVVRSRYPTVAKIATMFPHWQFEAVAD